MCRHFVNKNYIVGILDDRQSIFNKNYANQFKELTEFFTQMQQEVINIAVNKTTTSSTVIAVDMFTGFNDNLLADDVHYNEAGAVFIANRYYNVLINVLE